MKWLRLLVVLLLTQSLCGVIVSQEGPPIFILDEDEYTGDKSRRSGYNFSTTVSAGNNRILLFFASMRDGTDADMVVNNAYWEWVSAGDPGASFTIKTRQLKINAGADNIVHQIGYLLDPNAATASLRLELAGNVGSMAISMLVLENVDQDDPFDFTDLNWEWPQNTSFRTNYSLTATNDACVVDFLTKTNLPGAGQHALGIPGAHQTLGVVQEIGDVGSPVGQKGMTSISYIEVTNPVVGGDTPVCAFMPVGIVPMYRENTNTGPGGIYAIYEFRNASRCEDGSSACTP